MRNLTIGRTKSFVACLAKMKIYIEDAASDEMIINDTPCRKLGELKNGEERTFQIGEQAARVYVIADAISKGYCNEYYRIPEGQEDICLTGKNKLDLASGNAFRFDNNESAEILANRKKSTRKGFVILFIAAIVGAVAGALLSSYMFSQGMSQPKDFSSDGMTITLTGGFRKAKVENYTVAYDSKNVAVFVLKEEFTLADGFEDNTLEEYAELVIKANNLSSVETKTVDGLTCFEYSFTNPQTKQEYRYFSYVYKSDDAFWLVQFATLDKNVDEYAPQIRNWAKSVRFGD